MTEGGPENPIWALVMLTSSKFFSISLELTSRVQAQKWNITNTYSNYSLIQTFNGSGPIDYTDLIDDFNDAYSILEQDAGYILSENLQDRSVRSGLSLAGWKPKSVEAQAVEWWEWDWEYAYNPVCCTICPHNYSESSTHKELLIRSKAQRNLAS